MFYKISHRGAVEFAPENTISAFRKAVELGANAIECDVHLCKTGEMVIIHDETIDRTTNRKGLVSEMNYKDLQKLNAGNGEHIPTLQEVVNCLDKSIFLNIELKSYNTIAPVYELLESLIKHKSYTYSNFLVSAFNPMIIKELSVNYPLINVGILSEYYNLEVEKYLQKFKPYSFNIDYQYTTKEIVDSVHDLGIKIFVWTVNSKEDISRMKSLKVDGIFTDFPDRL